MTSAGGPVVILSPNGDPSVPLDAPPSRLVVGTSDGVVSLARDGTGRWTVVGRALRGRHIGALAAHAGGLLFAGCHNGGGVHRSADGGTSWTAVSDGIRALHVFLLASIRSSLGPMILAGIEPAGMYRSLDGGDRWSRSASLGHVPGAETWTFPPPPHIPHVK